MPTDAEIQTMYWRKALDAFTNGAATAPLFAKEGIGTISKFLAFDSTFGLHPSMVSMDAREQQQQAIARLHDSMKAKNEGLQDQELQWPEDDEEGAEYIGLVLERARRLQEAELQAIAQNLTTEISPAADRLAKSTDPDSKKPAADDGDSAKESRASLQKRGKALYDKALEIWPDATHAALEKRVKYTACAEMHDTYASGMPQLTPLGEFALEQSFGAKKPETVQHMGVTYVTRESVDKVVEITDTTTLYAMMDRRAQAELVAFGTIDHKAELSKRSPPEPYPGPPFTLESSKCQYITARAHCASVATIHAYASPKGLAVEKAAMTTFVQRNPHIPVSQLTSIIDVGVQKAKAQHRLDGHSLDAAVYMACVKSPELYSTTLCTAAPSATTAATASHAEDGEEASKQRGGRAGKRTISEQEAVYEKRLAQQTQQIENMKKKKGDGKGYGRNWNNNAWNGGGGGSWNDTRGGGQWQQWAGDSPGKGGGKGKGDGKGGGPHCPDWICKNFNFKVEGCTLGAGCKKTHICAACGANHCFRGNH